MFVHEDLVTIVFRLTSFGIFIFFCVCLFKRYLRPSILGMMRHEHDEQQKIKDRHKELEKQERGLEAATQEQEDRIRLLKERIARWQHEEQIAVQKENGIRSVGGRYIKNEWCARGNCALKKICYMPWFPMLSIKSNII